MWIERVKELEPLERFLYWIKERHSIYLKKEAGKEKPWTNDTILQNYFFTNPYRENDKVTKWVKQNIRKPLKDDDAVLFATIAFRWFNKPDPTGLILTNHGNIEDSLLCNWNEKKAAKLIREANSDGKQPVFTGAYMIKCGNGERGIKIPQVCACISNVWRKRAELVEACKNKRMQELHTALLQFQYMGGFMAYEICCDLRYTHLLVKAKDRNTWTNLGPGAKRGLARLNGLKGEAVKKSYLPKDWLQQIQKLLATVQKELSEMPAFEMREIEQSLCEFAKYETALWQDGMKMKRRYNGIS